MKISKKQLLILIVSQLLLLSLLAGYANLVFLTGTRTLLQVVPVDPRDIFRGDYVILGYEFSQIPIKEGEENQWSDLYILLAEKENGIYQMTSYSFTPPESGQLFIKGRINSNFNNTIWASYGIEAYFVEENTGRAIEEKILQGEVYAEVFISKNGFARVRSLVY